MFNFIDALCTNSLNAYAFSTICWKSCELHCTPFLYKDECILHINHIIVFASIFVNLCLHSTQRMIETSWKWVEFNRICCISRNCNLFFFCNWWDCNRRSFPMPSRHFFSFNHICALIDNNTSQYHRYILCTSKFEAKCLVIFDKKKINEFRFVLK